MEPITLDYRLPGSPGRAFDLYANRIGQWWDPEYTASPQTLQAITIEPHVGGRVYALHSDLGVHGWGEVTAWEPGKRLAYTSTLAQSRQYPSEITVRFEPDGDGCAMHFEHGGWNEHNAADRERFGDWGRILDRYARLARSA